MPPKYPAVTARQMRMIDTTIINQYKVPSIILMENAGRAVAESVQSYIKSHYDKKARIGIVCGGGNNGGDGLVAARHLHVMGFHVEVFMLKQPDMLKNDSKTNFSIITHLPIPIHCLVKQKEQPTFAGFTHLVDALLGTGTSGTIGEPYISTIRDRCRYRQTSWGDYQCHSNRHHRTSQEGTG